MELSGVVEQVPRNNPESCLHSNVYRQTEPHRAPDITTRVHNLKVGR
jgi:hypothetical protein